MTRNPKTDASTHDETLMKVPVCGIVMPIASMGEEYTAAHWTKVRKVLEIAAQRAGFRPNVVWDSPSIDIIQSKILYNIYMNDVIVCDLSGLNPNVMLEAGLRLSTKMPIVIVTDGIMKPPFDIASFRYYEYRKNLEYNDTERFIIELSEKISEVQKSYESNSYRPFIDSYKFEVAKPDTVQVPAEKIISDKLDRLEKTIATLAWSYQNERRINKYSPDALTSPQSLLQSNKDKEHGRPPRYILKFEYHGSRANCKDMIKKINPIGFLGVTFNTANDVAEEAYGVLSGFLLLSDQATPFIGEIESVLRDNNFYLD